MNTQAASPRCYEFDFPQLDTAIEIKVAPETVVILASRNSFSEERKRCFIRELAAEGFIDESWAWREPGGSNGMRWIVDPAEFLPGAAALARTRRFMLGLFFSIVALGLVLMGGVILSAGR